MKINLPDNVNFIIQSLQNHGYEAFAVGGCVRDSIIGRLPNDWDITTSALPSQIKSVFKRTVDTGIEHGTVSVLIDKEAYEVTTYREDSDYKDFRHPSSVEFVKSLEEDLLRRDFTINAMAYNYERGLVDPFDGLGDLHKKIIRCVGNPTARFSEDALRILRAVRFSAQLSFDIEENTKAAIQDLSHTLKHISVERICTELIKLITSPHPEYIRTAYELGITKVFFKEFDIMMRTPQNSPFHIYSVGEHTIKAMQSIDNDKILRLTMLLHDIGKPDARTTTPGGKDHFKKHAVLGVPMAKAFMRRLNMDNDTIKKVSLLIRYHDWRFDPTPENVRYAVSIIGKDLFPFFLKVQLADTSAKSDYKKQEAYDRIAQISEQYDIVISENHCVCIRDLCISGSDIIALGCPQGQRVGLILNRVLLHVIQNPQNNDKDHLREYIKHLLTEENNESS